MLYYFRQQQFYFNPRPREEGDVEILTAGEVPEDFNPRPREEGDFFQL